MDNVREKLKKSPNKDTILADIRKLQICQSVDAFDFGSNLFVEKWLDREKLFIRYFQRQWLKAGNKNWFEGVAPFTPSTNNSLESTNKRIKDDFNLRKQCPLSVFKLKALQVVKQYSREYHHGHRLKIETVKIPNKLWDIGLDLAKSKIGALTEDGVHYLPIIGMDAPSVEAVEAFNNYLSNTNLSPRILESQK